MQRLYNNSLCTSHFHNRSLKKDCSCIHITFTILYNASPNIGLFMQINN